MSGWRRAAAHLTFALLLALLMLHLLLIWFRKIPFTCSYFPGKTALSVAAFIYAAGFAVYVIWFSRLERYLLEAPAALIVFYALGILSLVGLDRLERRELSIDDVLIYEDQPEPVVRSLEIGP